MAQQEVTNSQNIALSTLGNSDSKEPWKVEAERVSDTLDQFRKQIAEKANNQSILSSDPYAPFRVNQLDAHILDKEVTEIVKIQFTRIFSFFKVGF
jgi:hypothetical protein